MTAETAAQTSSMVMEQVKVRVSAMPTKRAEKAATMKSQSGEPTTGETYSESMANIGVAMFAIDVGCGRESEVQARARVYIRHHTTGSSK